VTSVQRLDFGYFLRPAEETDAGKARAEPCFGYLIDHPEGIVLMDSGMGQHPVVDEHYRPHRRPLEAALADVGHTVDDVQLVVNCHLHFDHCGGNPSLGGRPVITQRRELEEARTTPGYTLLELVDDPSIRYEEVDGEVELLPGILVVPTPGHTNGHQSLVARLRDGTVIVAGQSHDTASAFGADALAQQLGGHFASDVPQPPAWIERLMALDPRRVVFAHDQALWEP